MKALTFLRSLAASQPPVVHPRLDQARIQYRIAVLANWLVAFLGRGRPQPAITAQQVFARGAFEAQATASTAAVSASRTEDIYRYRS